MPIKKYPSQKSVKTSDEELEKGASCPCFQNAHFLSVSALK